MNGGRMGIGRRSSRRRLENSPAQSARHTTRCKSTGGTRESSRKISRSGAGAADECAGAVAGDRPGGRLVCELDPGGAVGARVWLGAQPDHGGGDVAEVWVVS